MKQYYGFKGNRHNFCNVTGYCTRCGMPRDWFASSDIVVACISNSSKIVSLEWWRKLKAHQSLQDQLVASVATEMNGAITPKGD